MSLGAGAALAYLIASKAVGQSAARQTWPTWPYWLCLVMLLVGAALYGLSHRLKHPPESGRPELVFRPPTVKLRDVGWLTISTSSFAVTGTATGLQRQGQFEPAPEGRAWCVYAWVANVPVVGDDGVSHEAKDVHATLTFSDATTGLPIGTPLSGRWAKHPLNVTEQATLTPATMDLQGNGVAQQLDVAIQYYGEPECYAHNDQTRFAGGDFRGVPLGGYSVTVEISLQGSGVTASATYRLIPNATGTGPPVIRVL
jgi:hypothetical protein